MFSFIPAPGLRFIYLQEASDFWKPIESNIVFKKLHLPEETEIANQSITVLEALAMLLAYFRVTLLYQYITHRSKQSTLQALSRISPWWPEYVRKPIVVGVPKIIIKEMIIIMEKAGHTGLARILEG